MHYDVVEVPIIDIYRDDDFNCRGAITSESVESLAQSIKEDGLQTPVTIRPYNQNGYKYCLVAGHRRFTACKSIRMKTIPCFIRDLSEQESYIINLTENIQRRELDPIQIGNGFLSLFSSGLDVRTIAKKTGFGQEYINRHIAILRLPEAVKTKIAAGLISVHDIKLLVAAMNTGMSQENLIKSAERAMAIREMDNKIKKNILSIKEVLDQKPKKLKTVRSSDEFDELLLILANAYQNIDNLAIDALRWGVGGISTKKFLESVKKDLELYDIDFAIPYTYIATEEQEKRERGII